MKKLSLRWNVVFAHRWMGLAKNPFADDADVKKLQGRSGYRLRVGSYQVIYELENNKLIIQVLEIAHRKDIY